MKTKKISKKLSLKKTTISALNPLHMLLHLNDDEMKKLRGGVSVKTYVQTCAWWFSELEGILYNQISQKIGGFKSWKQKN
jgi:hypothetical protein